MKILGIVTARGGSKGIPGKNLRKIAGIPMIQYTFDSAKNSKIDKIIISTDDRKIAKFAESQGIEVPFLRPKSLATDTAKTFDVIKHATEHMKNIEKYSPEIVVILQPTSPLRTSKMINTSIDLLKKSHASSVVSVSEVKTHPYSAFFYDGHFLQPFKKDFKKFDRRQQYVPLYFPTGAIYTTWYKTISNNNSIYGSKIKPLITPHEESIDVDTKFDMFLAEATLLSWKKYLKKNFF